MTDTLIVDFSWMYHKCFHAYTDLKWMPHGVEIKTGGAYGCVRQVDFLYRKFKCQILVAIEPPDNTFRTNLFPQYKAGREHPPGIEVCWDPTIRMMKTLPFVSVVSARTGEADDVIFSLVGQSLPYCEKVYLYANDKDLLQVGQFSTAEDKVFYVGSKNALTSQPDKLAKAFPEISALQLPLYRSIVGDSSDNLAGPILRFPRRVAKWIAATAWTPQEFKEAFVPNGIEVPKDKTVQKYVALLLEEDNFKKWQVNYQIMRLQEVEVIFPGIEPMSVDEAVDEFGLVSLKRIVEGPTLRGNLNPVT